MKKKSTRASKKQIHLVLPAPKPPATQTAARWQATPVTQPPAAPGRRDPAPAGQPTAPSRPAPEVVSEPPAPIEPPLPRVATMPTVPEQIATQLGEKKPWPRRQIRAIVWALGEQQALELVERVQEVEASGGMLVTSGKRRRTVGGIFFHLAYSQGKPLPGRELKRPVWNPGRKKKAETAVTV